MAVFEIPVGTIQASFDTCIVREERLNTEQVLNLCQNMETGVEVQVS